MEARQAVSEHGTSGNTPRRSSKARAGYLTRMSLDDRVRLCTIIYFEFLGQKVQIDLFSP